MPMLNVLNTPQAQHILIPITGLSCAGCVSSLEKSMASRDQVVSVSVNLALSMMDLELIEEHLPTVADINEWVKEAGYGIDTASSHYTIANASCASCVKTIETAVKAVPGVVDAQFNLALSQLSVTTINGVYDESQLAKKLADLQYPLVNESINEKANEPTNEPTNERTLNTSAAGDNAAKGNRNNPSTPLWPIIIPLMLAAPMVLVMLLAMAGLPLSLSLGIQWLLATPVQFYFGWPFYKGAYNSLKHGSANMDVLVVMGTSAAYFYSVFIVLWGDSIHVYFEASAVVIALVLLGRYLEARAKNISSNAIRQLINLQPKMAKVWRDGTLLEVPIGQVQVGDQVQISPGETITVDGKVIAGESDINEAMLTGESVPVHKSIGEKVLAGTHNIDGSLRVLTEKTAAEFRVKQIATLVEQAQMNKPAIQQLVDNIAAVFVPVVIAIALLTLIVQASVQGFEFGLMAAISVLIIACPCALGLATPTAIIAASGVGAKHGLLIKDINQLEMIAKAKHCVFDKTGTLTEGHLALVEHSIWSENAEELYPIVYSLESRSQHPLATALTGAFARYANDVSIEQFQNHSGKGITGMIAGTEYALGNQKLMQDLAIDVAAHQHRIKNPSATIAWLAKKQSGGYEPLGVFELNDTIKANAKPLMQWLQQQSVSTWLLSGDSQRAAEQVGQALAIENVQGDLLPDHKLDKIKRIKATGGAVIMVGDGINDAPALAAADASIAMGNGTDIAIETAGITLMRPDITLVADAIQLAKKTRSKIKQNLFWAFFYNTVGIPLAALGLLSPMVAGSTMAFSSVSVVLSSMLLLRWQAKALPGKK